jgi:cysteine synthase A
VPENLNLAIVDEVITVSNEDAISTAQRLAREKASLRGIPLGQCLGRAASGGSSGE